MLKVVCNLKRKEKKFNQPTLQQVEEDRPLLPETKARFRGRAAFEPRTPNLKSDFRVGYGFLKVQVDDAISQI